jgi:hypothetical protein
MRCFACSIILLGASVLLADPTSPAPAGAASRPSDSSATTQPLSPDQMLSQMLKPTGREGRPLPPPEAPAIDRKSGSGALAPAAQSQTVLREGTDIVNRIGRLQKSADGQQPEFLFDSDGKALRDPPMVLLPNLKLMAIETATMGQSRELRFRVSGVVTEYHGRNYLLLDKAVVVEEAHDQF